MDSTNNMPQPPSKRERRARSLKKGAIGGAASVFVAAWAVIATTHGAATNVQARTTANDAPVYRDQEAPGGDDSGSYYDGRQNGHDSDLSDPLSIAEQAAKSALNNATDYSAPAAPSSVTTGQS